ncbi:elongation factor 1-alpha C-terminal domain-related protein [Anseongella ginsenosidimutans]
MIVKENNQPQMEQDIDIMICWLNARGPQPGAKYTIRHTSRETRAVIKDVVYKMDINTLQRVENDAELKMNDIARVRLRTMQRLIFDSYRRNRNTGSLVLIDENTNETVAAGMIV